MSTPLSTHADDHAFMARALRLAEQAAQLGEVPVGAVVVCDSRIVGEGYNLRETQADPLAHAEIRAIASAAKELGRWRLSDCTLYVTLEPCAMCTGALINSRMGRLVYGADDPKAGAVNSLYQMLQDERFNHNLPVASGVCAEECGEVLKVFFRQLRADKKKSKDKNEKHG